MPDLIHPTRALLSVSDKSGLADFAAALHRAGVHLISTGGTAKAIRDAGLPVQDISDFTGFPEMMDGRVKTLHPKVHGGLLARRDLPEHTSAMRAHGIAPIDLVCINLYPFEQTVANPAVHRDEAVEQIDIGGPSMVRSAAKNHDWVAVVTSPQQYADIINELAHTNGAISLQTRRTLAAAAFARTAAYDTAIASYLTSDLTAANAPLDADAAPAPGAPPAALCLSLRRVQGLRYGENPHQPAAVFAPVGAAPSGVVGATQLHGKPLSYNNLLDASAAYGLVTQLARTARTLGHVTPAACVVKHTNPCGAASAPDVRTAVELAFAGDPVAAFGGILAVSATIDARAAECITAEGRFVEVVIAPAYADDALQLLRSRWKNVRLLVAGAEPPAEALDLRAIAGGYLAQRPDDRPPTPDQWVHAAGPAPDARTLRAAAMLEPVVRALSSNAVLIGGPVASTDPQAVRLFGAGAGQMDRVASCRIAVQKAGDLARGAIAVGDAFFPFPDGPAVLIEAGVRTIVHPGGSVRDGETFALCNERGVTCLTTGVRRFRH